MSSPAPPLNVSADQRQTLELWARSQVLSQRQVLRARIVLMAAEGVANEVIAGRLGCSKPNVLKWRSRFELAGMEGLEEASGRGRPAIYAQDFVEKMVATTLGKPPEGSTHWSTRTLAKELGVSHGTVHRIWRQRRLQPHRTNAFKFSSDPQLVERVRDVVGLYLNPPEKALVLCVEEERQIQSLDRTQPLLPMRPGQPERRTHDHVRHGTTTLFAALDVATGEVVGDFTERHGVDDLLAFLRRLAKTYAGQELHLILDNYDTHKHSQVARWLERHQRVHLHFTPSGATWMNQVEIWFSLLHSHAIARGVFRSVAALREAIQRFVNASNQQCRPFTWIKPADQILALSDHQRSCGTGH
ncbi:MAG: IS630 family transposase [Candidatus Nephthysia bennettiae]|uniref:IS630 family transposase n=1 Tax=Candidatus Nephthysia bennettiae TaxID=3127016 RepID=A0A934K762_9BACT|nr:IS630 family transposase [Candidatus Dormibacteraeota bacterium]PZR90989.1 MAG: IS630 family transposase [Candidatus Dormibacteraeota bacterium]